MTEKCQELQIIRLLSYIVISLIPTVKFHEILWEYNFVPGLSGSWSEIVVFLNKVEARDICTLEATSWSD